MRDDMPASPGIIRLMLYSVVAVIAIAIYLFLYGV